MFDFRGADRADLVSSLECRGNARVTDPQIKGSTSRTPCAKENWHRAQALLREPPPNLPATTAKSWSRIGFCQSGRGDHRLRLRGFLSQPRSAPARVSAAATSACLIRPAPRLKALRAHWLSAIPRITPSRPSPNRQRIQPCGRLPRPMPYASVEINGALADRCKVRFTPHAMPFYVAAFAGLMFFALSPGADPSERIHLVPKFVTGQSFRYHIESRTTTTGTPRLRS